MNRFATTLVAAAVFCLAPACDDAATDDASGQVAKTPKDPTDANKPVTADKTPAVEATDEPMSDPTTDNLDPKVVKAAAIAREIEANPSDADSVLEKHGLDRDALDHLMYEIARNPDLSRAYRDARTS